MLVLDSGGVSYLAARSAKTERIIRRLRHEGLWPPAVPSAVLVECLTGHPGRDAHVNMFLKTCDVIEEIPERLARRAALVRSSARRGSAVDAIVAVTAEPAGAVVTGDVEDLAALAEYTDGVRVVAV